MKKILLVFILLFNSFLFADEIISNSEISLIFDDESKEISYVKGNLFKPVDISKIDFFLLEDSEKFIDLQNYLYKVEKIKNTEILKIEYKIDEKNITLSVLPSLKDKEILIFNLEFKGNFTQNKLFMNITTQRDGEIIDIDNESKYLEYSTFSIFSPNEESFFLTSKDQKWKEFIFNDKGTSFFKKRDETILLALNKIDDNMSSSIIFDFSLIKEKNYKIPDYLEEKKLWDERIKIDTDSRILNNALEGLTLLKLNILLPNKISVSISEENFVDKSKTILISELYKLNIDKNRILEDYNLKKKDIESIEIFSNTFKFLDNISYGISSKYFDTILKPQVLSLLDFISDEGEILGLEDSIEVYYKLYKLIELLDNRVGFEEEKEWILERKKILENYVNKNFFRNNKIMSRKIQDQYSYQNVKYLDIFMIENKFEYLKNFYNKYLDKNFLLLKDDERYIDIDFNLEMIILFYKYGLIEQADTLFKSLDNLISSKLNFYIVPKYYIYDKTNVEINLNSIYLYLLAFYEKSKIDSMVR